MAMTIPEHILAEFLVNRRLGMSVDDSARCAGFNPKTFFDWKKRAAADPKRYPAEAAFMVRYWKAKASGVRYHMANVNKHAKTDLRASIKWLAWNGYSEKLEVAVDARATITIDTSKLPRELLDAICDGDDLNIPEGLLDEVLAAQGEQ